MTDEGAFYHNYKASILGRILIVLRILLLIFILILAVPLYYIWRILRLSNPWPRLFLRATALCVGARVYKKGTALKRDVFFVANHISWLDIPVMGGRSGAAFVAQDGIESWPFIGWLCRLNNTIFVSRENRMAIANQINRVRQALEESWAVTIFPEGTTTDGSELLPFKSPLLATLDPPPPGVMVQPVYIDYGAMAKEIAWIGEESAPANAWRIFTGIKSFKVVVNFLDPFDPRDFVGRKAIAAECKARIVDAMEEKLLPIHNSASNKESIDSWQESNDDIIAPS